ncbi:hypothetical protein H8959_011457 [Pygathrix nigripes]
MMQKLLKCSPLVLALALILVLESSVQEKETIERDKGETDKLGCFRKEALGIGLKGLCPHLSVQGNRCPRLAARVSDCSTRL